MSFHVRQATLSAVINLISNGDVSYHFNDQVIGEIATDSDFPICTFWLILNYSITHSIELQSGPQSLL